MITIKDLLKKFKKIMKSLKKMIQIMKKNKNNKLAQNLM